MGRGDRGPSGRLRPPGLLLLEIAKVSVGTAWGGSGLQPPDLLGGGHRDPRSSPSSMDASKEPTGCPARGTCPVFLAMSSGAVRYAPSAFAKCWGEEAWDTGR